MLVTLPTSRTTIQTELPRWLRYCVKKARQRQTPQQYRLHALLVKGGSVLAQGYNVPATEFPGKALNPRAPEWIGLHAELACLKKATEEQISGSTLYVGGVTWSGNLLLSKPCEFCWQVLEQLELARVVWHTPAGQIQKYTFR